ncbi:MAG: serine hydrolase [Blastocatellia bacterium]
MQGMIMWLSYWYKPNGPISKEQAAAQYGEILLNGLLLPKPEPKPAIRKRSEFMTTNTTNLMSRRVMIRSLAGGLMAGRTILAAQPKPYYPRGKDWETRAPKDAAMDAAALDDAAKYAAEHNSTGLVIVRGGRIVTEQYWQQWTAETAQPIFSSSKSVTATLVGMAIEEGKLKGVEQSASAFVSAWKGSPKEAITIRHMLAMTSGIRVGAVRAVPEVDAFAETAALPLEHQPGEQWAYYTPALIIVSATDS